MGIDEFADVGRATVPVRLIISIPTHNRYLSLGTLLDSLSREPEVARGEVNVVVHDNASTDQTEVYLRQSAANLCWLEHRRNLVNIGGVANIRLALNAVDGYDYVWVLSDHMIVLPGAVGRLVKLLTDQRPAAACAGIVQYAKLLGQDQCIFQPDRLTPRCAAALYFHFSNISSVVSSSALVADAVGAIETCGHYSYPHLGLWSRIRTPGSQILFVPGMTSFNSKGGGKGYAWFASGVVDYVETIRLTNDKKSASDLLRATGAMSFYRNTLFRHLLGVRSGLVRENVSAAAVIRACRDLHLSIGSRVFLRLLMRLPRRVAVSLSAYLAGPRGLKALIIEVMRCGFFRVAGPVGSTSSITLRKFD